MTDLKSAVPVLATFQDIPAIASLEAVYYASEGYPAGFLYQALAQWPQGLWVVKTAQEVIGYALVTPAQHAGEYWLMAALVSSQARGQGLGEKLCERSIHSCKESGGKALWLSVAPDNITAIKLYRKLGFIEEGLQDDFLGPGEHRILMRCPLV